jgi:hypothetical protein
MLDTRDRAEPYRELAEECRRLATSVTSGVNFTENQRFESRWFLAAIAKPSLHVEVLSPDRGRGEMPANVALGGRAWSGDNPL